MLSLGSHAGRCVHGSVGVVDAGSLHDLEEESVGKAFGVDVEVVAVRRPVEQHALRSQPRDDGGLDVDRVIRSSK